MKVNPMTRRPTREGREGEAGTKPTRDPVSGEITPPVTREPVSGDIIAEPVEPPPVEEIPPPEAYRRRE